MVCEGGYQWEVGDWGGRIGVSQWCLIITAHNSVIPIPLLSGTEQPSVTVYRPFSLLCGQLTKIRYIDIKLSLTLILPKYKTAFI